MGKRSRSSLCSPQEAKQYSQLNYDHIIKESQKEKPSAALVITPVSRELPEDAKIRSYWSCDCRNEQGWCRNYLLEAIVRDRCVIR